MRLRFLIGCWVPLAVAGMLRAQEPADPPSRVARLNYLDGSVSYRPMSITDWAPAALNYPLTTGDRLWVEKESRAELHIGSIAIHLAPQTAFAILNLDDRLAQISISQGTLYLRVPSMNEDDAIEVDTPNGAMNVLKPGAYRIDIDVEHNATSMTVRSGQAEVSGNGRVFTIGPDRMLQLVADNDVADIQQAPEPDPWEDWCVGRDQLTEHEAGISDNYVAPDVTGAEDLAEYGTWSINDDYGPVWVPPAMPAGWAPYRYGHWAYVPPWGWTWIDEAPWGFAPFHYGRWVWSRLGWEWVPVKRGAAPVYAPALVTFVTSSGLSASVAARGGRVAAWTPLGPGEVFHPNYRASESYLQRINGGARNEVTNINGTFVTAVPREAFVSSRPVSVASLRIPPGAGANIKPVTTVDDAPVRAGSAKAPAPPPKVAARAVYVQREVPPPVKAAIPIHGEPAPADRATEADARTPGVPAGNPPVSNAPPDQPAQTAPAMVPVYIGLPSVGANPVPAERAPRPAPAPVNTRPVQRQETPAYTPPPSPPARHEESRPAPPVFTPPPQHQESRPTPVYTPPPPPPAPARHEESRPAPASKSEDKRDDGGSKRK